MLEYYTGVPGSGKTYRAVDHVYNCFIDQKSKHFGKYEHLYTNINEFKFEMINETEINDSQSLIEEIAFSLRMDELLEQLEILRTLYLEKNPDSVLVQRASELHLTDTLFVIDEAHNFFDDKNDTLIWWLSYHRHLHQDIILITQNLSLIYRKYLSFGEFFYRAVAPSLRIRGGVFTYHQFVKYQMFKNSHTDSIKVNFNKNVFSLYGSGANTQSKKVIYKFIVVGVVLAVLVFIGFNVFSNIMGSSDDHNVTQPLSKIQSSSSPSFAPIDRTSSFTVVCIGFECSCMGQNFPLSALNTYSSQYALQAVDTTMSSNDIVLRTFARNDRFFKEVLNVSNDSVATH